MQRFQEVLNNGRMADAWGGAGAKQVTLSGRLLRRLPSAPRFFCLLIAGLFGWAGGLLGAEPGGGVRKWSALTIDNDFFHGSDEQYTGGGRFTRIHAGKNPGLFPQGLKPWSRRLLFEEDGVVEEGWFLAQYIFTPSDRQKEELGPADRPYAGWLGGGVWVRETVGPRSRALGVTFGIAGPASLAENVQDGLHRIIGHDRYAWSEEIHNELTFNLHLRESHRLWVGEIAGLHVRVDSEGGLDLGNAQAGLVGRAIVRLGTFEPAPYFPTERFGPGPSIAAIPANRSFGWGFTLGAEGRVVGRDLFLDGNTFRESHSVESRLLVGSLMAGFSVRMQSWLFHYTFVYHGRSFKGQEKPHRYGSLVLAKEF